MSRAAFTVGRWQVDPDRNRLQRGDEVAGLTPRAMDVLCVLHDARGDVCSVAQILDLVWDGRVVEPASVHQQISLLRKTLGDDAAFLETIPRRGYRLAQAVSEAPVAGDSAMTTFVGRSSEMAHFDDAFAATVDGVGRTVLVVGEPGSGKTWLVERCLERYAARSLVLQGWCDESSHAPPYWPWMRVLREALLSGTLQPDPILGVVLPEIAQAAEPEYPPGELAFRVGVAVAALLRELARECPVVVYIDDLHRADEASLSVFGVLVRELRRTPVLLIAAYRLEETRPPLARLVSEIGRTPAASRLQVPGLSRDDVLALGESSGVALEAGSVDRILESTGSNALFVSELVRAGAVATETIPSGVADVVLGRLADLSESGRVLLECGAVCGRDLASTSVQSVVGLTDDSWDAAVAEGIRTGFLTRSGPRDLRFRHVLVRDALYEALDPRKRQNWHTQLADALESGRAAHTVPERLVIARHRVAAGQPLAAAEQYAICWRKLYATSYLETYRTRLEALDALSDLSGLSDSERRRACELTIVMAAGALHCGSWCGISIAEGRALITRAEEAYEQSGLRITLVQSMQNAYSDLLSHRGELEEALALVQRLDGEIADSSDTALRLLVKYSIANRLNALGRYEEVWQLAEAVLANPPDDPLVESSTSSMLYNYPRVMAEGGFACAMMGDPHRGLAYIRRSIAHLRHDRREVEPAEIRVTAHKNSYVVSRNQLPHALRHAAFAYALQGAMREARECADEYKRCAQDESPQPGQIHLLGDAVRCQVMALQGAWSELAELAEAYARVAARSQVFANTIYLVGTLGAVAFARLGEKDKALTRLGAEPPRHTEAMARLRAAEAWTWVGGEEAYASASTQLAHADRLISAGGALGLMPLRNEVSGMLARASGRQTQAERLFDEAERGWTAMQAPWHVERVSRERDS